MGRFLTQHIAARKINACDNMTINLLQQRCKNLKPVQSCENVVKKSSADAMLHVSIFCATILPR